MGLRFETRGSDSPWVDTVWACTSERVTQMTSVAAVCWGLVFWELDGRAYAAVSGPETRTGTAPVPEGATFVGVEFAVGTSLRAVPTPALVDGGVELPGATRRTFRLDGHRWETPGPDDAEALVDRLVRGGIVVRDPLVTGVRRGHRPAVSARTLERRFQAVTGLTQGAVRQSALPWMKIAPPSLFFSSTTSSVERRIAVGPHPSTRASSGSVVETTYLGRSL
ncbi:AraC family transcriptional regulator [Phytohabitans suffuscus]|uniref:AraC family transcriptional regulator n=1 Tax=Phytohabitans suffuscus TaxID=624315 RepID=UPI001E4B9C0C|nr:AraC family transcriptional regulator [Phytohabitans suffuscus]